MQTFDVELPSLELVFYLAAYLRARKILLEMFSRYFRDTFEILSAIALGQLVGLTWGRLLNIPLRFAACLSVCVLLSDREREIGKVCESVCE